MDKCGVEVTDAMISAGMDALYDYELGGISCDEMLRQAFTAMLAAAPTVQPENEVSG